MQRRLGENTRAVHLPPPPVPAQQPFGTPVYRTATFAFGSAEEYADVLNDRVAGYTYSRIDNPTVDAFAAAVAALESVNLPQAQAAKAFSSGMGAVSGVFWALARAGAHVVAPAAVYGGTYGFLRNVASRFGVETDFADLPGLARLAHEANALLVVDSTLAPPVVCRPLEHGADLVLHSATKYMGGHSDVTGGVVTGRPELISRIRAVRIDTGASLAPDEAYLLRRG